MDRPKPTSLNVEPCYPGIEGMVMLSMSNPDWTGHLKDLECDIEEPHKVEDCGLWSDII